MPSLLRILIGQLRPLFRGRPNPADVTTIAQTPWCRWVVGAFIGLISAPALAGLAASVTLQSGQPANIRPGETTVLEITLSNNNAAAAINSVAFSNSLPGTLPNGLKVAGPPTYTCFDPILSNTIDPGAGTLTANLNTQALSLTGGSIPQRNSTTSTDGTCTIRIPVTAGTATGAATNYTYTIADGAVTGNDGAPVTNVGSVSQSINILALNPPTISKSFSNATAILGGPASTLTITINNPNPTPLPNFSITDTFPTLGPGAIIQVATPPNATSTCTGAGTAPTFAPVAGDLSVTASGGTVAASGSCTLTVDVVARQTNGTFTTGARTNTINRTSDFSNDIGIQAQANATAPITARSPLRLTKAFSPASLASGQSGSMTVRLFNDGTTPLLVTSFTDSPIDGNPDPAFGLTVTGQATTCSGGTVTATTDNQGVTLTGGTIPAGGSCTVTANFTATTEFANTPITYTNSIAQGAVDVGNPAIVSQTTSATILVADSLRVVKRVNTTNPRPGNPVQFQIDIQNWSAAVMTNAVITDALDNGMTFLTGTINGNNFTPTISGPGCGSLVVTSNLGDASANFTIGSVPARASDSAPGVCTVTFYAMTATGASGGSSISNVVPAGAVCVDGPLCNGGASNTTGGTVTSNPLTVAKSFSPAGPLNEGTITRMTITLTNFSANPLTAVAISDTLPTAGAAQLRVASPANAATTCGGTVTATAGSTSVALNGGTVPARASLGAGAAGTCTLSVDVVGPAGVYNNTATAEGIQTFANGATQTTGPISDTEPLTYNSILSATKSFSPGTVASGGRSTATVRLANSGPVALFSVSVTDPLPAGMVLASPPNAYTTCAGSTSLTATAGASSITLTGATVAGSGNCDLVFDVIATGSANWVNTIPVGGITAAGGVFNQSAVVGTLNFNAGNALTLSKATNPSTLTFPGQTSVMTITITNGATAVTGLSFTDFFTVGGTSGAPLNGMITTASPAATTTCPGGVASAAPNARSVSLSGATLAASASCTVSVNVSSTVTGGIINTIPPSAITTNQGLTNNLEATTSLTTQTNLGIVKQFTPSVIKPNQRARLRLTFTNAGSVAASSLAVVDTLPTGLTVPAGPNATTTCVGATVSSPATNQVQVSGGNLGAAVAGTPASCQVEIDVLAGLEGAYVNEIPAGALTAMVEGSPVSNSAPTSATLLAKNPLVVHKAIDSRTLDTGNPAGFTTGEATRSAGAPAPLTISISNPNTTALTAVAFTDVLPAGLVVALTPAASTTCTGGIVTAPASATSVRLSGATIPASGSCTVTVNMLSNIAGSYTNTLPTGSVTTFEGVSNENPSSARIVITSPSELGKQFDPPVIPPGGVSKLTIFVGNPNESNMTLTANLNDNLPTAPAPLIVASPNGLVNTCTGSVVANPGAGQVRLNSGAVVPPGGCRIEVNVTAATGGVYNNNIPVGALQTNFGSNQQPANAPLWVSTLGYISGRVFKDNKTTPDGVYDPAISAPLAGVEIQLRSGPDGTGPVLFTTFTDAQGNYLFPELLAGTYSVVQPAQPAGTLNGTPLPGVIVPYNSSTGTPGVASNPTDTSSQIVGIVLNNNGNPGEVSGSTGNNFSEVATSRISGVAFLDINNDGVQQGADPALPGVTINLTGTDWLGRAVTRTTTTDSSGAYVFDALPPGTYTVTQPNQPAGTASGLTIPGAATPGGTAGTATPPETLPSAISGIVLPPNTSSTANNFAEIPLGRSIFGQVFLDSDNNGVPDGSDSGIAGQTIQLTGTDINGNPVSRTTTTDPTGAFSFTGLPEGTYTLTQPNQPAGTLNGITTAGTTGGTATSPDVTPSVISNINLSGPNQVSANNWFGEIFNPASVLGTVSGVVFNDPNGNGVQDPGEPGLSGVTIELLDSASNVIATTLTDADGNYSFPNVPPGTYTVRQTDPAGFISTTPNNVAVTVPPGGSAFAQFGNRQQPAQQGAVSGTVFNDLNGNGVQDPGETGLSGVTIELLDSNGNVVATTLTDANGNYSFSNVAPGAYTVRETDPAGFTSTTLNTVPVSVAPGGAATANFGDQPQGTVSGTVFNDLNGNGVQDPGETGLSGVTIELLDSAGNVVDATTTDANGNYSFPNVPPGAYTVRETDPAGFTSTTPNTVPISVPAGGAATANFGDQQQGTVSGTVFNDLNGNGVQDPGETGLSGVTIELLDSAGNVVDATTTDANGNYSFPNVPPGAYTVRETDPAGFTSTTPNTVPISVPAGGAATANFGDQQQGTVSGTVFNDLNGNGAQDPGEAGLPGVTIELLDDAGNVVATTLTDANGNYSFPNVAPGAYTVRETDPAGFTSTTPNSIPVSVAPGGAATANFGDQQPGAISGTVFNDLNGNGVRDPGEPGLGGVTIELLDSNGNVIATTTTTGDGRYIFLGLDPGTYTVREIDPPGFVSTTPNERTATVPPGGIVNTDFGDQQQGVISGAVFNDLNGDGVRDPGEAGIGGVLIELLDSNGTIVATTTTVGNGTYSFPNVVPGDYTVRQTDPTGFTSTTPNFVAVTVPPGGSASAQFGDRQQTAQQGAISGTVFNDLNGNGARDPGEPGIGGVRIELLDGAGNVVATTTTAADGGYRFTGVQPGSYTVRETDPPGFTSTTPNSVPVNVAPNGSATVNFGNRLSDGPPPVPQPGNITGVVFNDLNGNGIQDAGESGIPGVTVTLSTGATATTDGNGRYTFANLTPGSYTVVVGVPSGYTNTTPVSVSAPVTAGGTATANFGIQQRPTLFDPPSGRKTVNTAGFPVIEWRMVWINDSNTAANRVRVIDPVPAGAIYDPDSLRCEARGQSTVATCVFEPANNRVVYEGNIAPDPGASDEADAQNEVVIVFSTLLQSGVSTVENLASAHWDRNGNGSVDDDITGNQLPVETNNGQPVRPPVDIPLLAPWLFWILAGLLALMGAIAHQNSGWFRKMRRQN